MLLKALESLNCEININALIRVYFPQRTGTFCITQAIAILQKRERSEEDLYLLRTLLRQIQFFKDRSMNDEDLLDVASCMKLEVKEKGEDIIRIGNLFHV